MTVNEIERLAAEAEASLEGVFARVDGIARRNTAKVLDAFAAERISESCFAQTTGYGYDDKGRDALERVFARVFGAERALVRPHFINGTHAIACGLYGALRGGETLLCATGLPYDTLIPVVFGDEGGSLREYGVTTEVTELTEPDGRFDAAAHLARVEAAARRLQPAAALIQRSRGYGRRPT
ncbi:MAG: methionine gamma-lyase family protein, partial [Oscillospiraceae bacterium]|nr:methionine gamma-lyase family protein [Oscillospiraceae bacterium]